MYRDFDLFVAAPGRQEEAEHALRLWLGEVARAPQFRGGTILREYAGEFGDLRGALAVIYDVNSREEGKAFREGTKNVPNPMSPDLPGKQPPDQGAILFFDKSAHRRDQGGDHTHAESQAHDSHVPHDVIGTLDFNRGGGLLARLMHGHFEILMQAPFTEAGHGAAAERTP